MMLYLSNLLAFGRRHHTPFKYLVIGGLAYVLEMATLFLIKQNGFTDLFAVAISFWVGFIVAFIMQKLITFNNKARGKKEVSRQLLLYSSLVAFNYIFTLVAVGVSSRLIEVYIARTIVIGITTVWNYAIYKFIFENQ